MAQQRYHDILRRCGRIYLVRDRDCEQCWAEEIACIAPDTAAIVGGCCAVSACQARVVPEPVLAVGVPLQPLRVQWPPAGSGTSHR